MNRNKKIILIISFFLIISSWNMIKAQENGNEIEFQTNLEETFSLAKQSNEYVLVYFSGSDWCRPCMQLQQEVFESDEFVTFSKSNLLVVRLDFPAKEKNELSDEQTDYNKKIAERLNKKGVFPYMILFDSEQKQLDEISGYSRLGAKSFIERLKSKMTNE
ncbi:MAG: thioredoxin fold domain-containing protein [Ignavibacteriae bacterium]|nr:thioredoxin fold domain-containing protein [Ignavibacteriota bacterium]